MSVRTPEEIMNAVREYVGDNADDTALTLIEDINDTLNNASNNENIDWKTRYEQNDATWRKRYRDRFFSTPQNEEEEQEQGEGGKPLTYESLFKED